MTGWNNWRAGSTATAAEFVTAANSLLDAILADVPGERTRGELLTGLAASLATSGREAVVAVEHFESTGDDRRREIAVQARVIGTGIAELASATADRGAAVRVRSNCEGHVWTPEVAALLTGSPNALVVMQQYNEWLHQLVVLRDALLPFRNWEEVRLLVDERGLRRVEDARRSFLADLLTRSPRHDAVVRLAAVAVSDLQIPERAYGFRVESGVVLPSVVSGSSLLTSPGSLLDWSGTGGRPTAFVPTVDDYLSVPTTTPTRAGRRHDPEYALAESNYSTGKTLLTLQSADGPDVDLGQALRGHRYAYRAVGGDKQPPDDDVPRYEPADVLAADGLVDFPPGTHLIAGAANALTTLATLGKVLPHNIVLWDVQDWSTAASTGKAGPPRVVLSV
ncbi:hypothetical protein [Rhodococcus gannanensis]|uniref:Uncharacterized protein n=1 Tax=Rhodococcus gannanensis TaxID=1960308 RepID=A0ABW4P3E6_9NOCA